jgi:hypothetical protein
MLYTADCQLLYFLNLGIDVISSDFPVLCLNRVHAKISDSQDKQYPISESGPSGCRQRSVMCDSIQAARAK